MKAIIGCLAAAVLSWAICSPVQAGTVEDTWNRCLRLDKIERPPLEDVIEACREVLKMDYVDADTRNGAFNNIGVAYMSLGKYDEALKALSEALIKIRELPDVPEARQYKMLTLRNRAKANIGAKHYANALSDYDAIARMEPASRSHSLRCLTHALYEDDFANALADCQKAFEVGPNDSNAAAGWLIVEFRQGKYQDVKADCALLQKKAPLAQGIEVGYICSLVARRLEGATSNLAQNPNLLNAELNLMEHGVRFRELGIVP